MKCPSTFLTYIYVDPIQHTMPQFPPTPRSLKGLYGCDVHGRHLHEEDQRNLRALFDI